MYNNFFGLSSEPFALTPDTEFFFNDRIRQEALNTLVYGVRSGEGFIKVVGEVGTGKTTLCRQFLQAIEGEAKTAYILDPVLRGEELVRALAHELGIEPGNRSQTELVEAIKTLMLETWEQGRPVVLLLDEAQALPLETLEQLRLLSNLETEKAKLLRIVLMGQPELDVRLREPTIRQLRQRIVYTYRLFPLGREDLSGYLEHRMRVAGYNGGQVFRPNAVSTLYRGSQGILRLVNILAHKSLLAAYGDGEPQVRRRHVRAAIRDTESARRVRWLPIAGAWGAPVLATGHMILKGAGFTGPA
ncbi:ExeA family protein [Thiohalorhabdus methylotrophus]|uniref:ExeA family protein n=1 Tax=Thiohalorhabdus methylotrophus TaxID=3242694 RepID=A0ABV4U0N4_9GAMM